MLLLLLALACDPSVGEPVEAFTTRVPVPTGDVTVRVHAGPAERAHFPGEAPVVVVVDGGWGPGDLDLYAPLSEAGYVVVDPTFPGATGDGWRNDGEDDLRGADSLAALASVVRYASGDLADADGTLLRERVPHASPDNLGVFGRSNGGNAAIAAIAEHGLAQVRWLVVWESPVGDQYVTLELNDNPYYVPGTCGVRTCPWDGLTEALVHDPDAVVERVLSDDELHAVPGAIGLDLDGDGALTPDDRVFLGIVGPSDPLQLYPSVELSEAIDAAGLPRPAWLPPHAEVDAFWALRDGSRSVAAAHQVAPDLFVLHVGGVADHMQDSPDYPHARSHIEAWLEAGHTRVRLNPDPSCLARLTGLDKSSFPDNGLGEPVPWPGTAATMLPAEVDGVDITQAGMQAAVLEAVERTHGLEQPCRE